MSALALALLLSIEPVPRLSGPVVDLAGMIDQGHRDQLEQLARAARAENEGRGVQLQILTMPSIGDEPIEDFSIRVAEDWKIGLKGADNGILIVVAKAERRFRIEVGGGLEGDLTDLQSKRILDDTLKPAFVRGDFGGGLYSAAVAALTAVHGLPEGQMRSPGFGPPPFRPHSPVGAWGVLGALLLFFFGSAGGFSLLILLVFIFFLSTRLGRYGGYGGGRGRWLGRRGLGRGWWRRLERRWGRVLGRRRLGRLVMKPARRIDKFFDDAARARVAEAVKAAEARTSGQIVPVVVARSHNYRSAVWLANTWTTLLLLCLVFVQNSGPALHSPLVVAALALVVMTLLAVTAMPRLLIKGEFENAVRQRAMLAFVEQGVYRTREENGVLLFASLYERKVVVLGDRAVHQKLGDEHWKRAVETLVSGIRAGDPAGGFCKAIADIGEEMARAFPRGASPQPNEISDDLRIDR